MLHPVHLSYVSAQNAITLRRHRRKGNPNLRHGRSTVSFVALHFVWCVKYRKRVLTSRVFSLLSREAEAACNAIGVEMIEINAEANHVHMIAVVPPSVAPSRVMHRVKGRTAKAIRDANFLEIEHGLPRPRGQRPKHLWSPSYFVNSTGGAPLGTLLKYVKSQAPLQAMVPTAYHSKSSSSSRNTLKTSSPTPSDRTRVLAQQGAAPKSVAIPPGHE